MTAQALQILIPSRRPNGIKLIKVFGRDGLCYIIPRQSLNELSTDSDVNNPGLYFLFGKDEYYRFTKDAMFRSPSAAASTITARSTNGWTAWKGDSGNTLDQNLRQHKDSIE
jgi:hypothetical protein